MASRSRKRRRSRASSHLDDDADQTPTTHEPSILEGGKFRPNCEYIKCLEEWVHYAEHVAFDYQVDLYTYIFKGHAILAAHQRAFYKCPARYLWFLMSLPTDDDSVSDAALHALVRSAAVRVSEMLDSYNLLEKLAVDNHGGEYGNCEAKLGALGWSVVTQVWHMLCILRFHIAMVQQLLHVFEHDVRAAGQLKHVRMVPRTLSIAELCGLSYEASSASVQSTAATLPRSMCPPELLHSAHTLAPKLLSMGCTLYPHLPIGLYSQFQVYQQLSFLSQQLPDMDIGQPALALFVRALHLRSCELLHHSYVVPNAWDNALLPCDVGPSRPLDMVPPERYRLAHRFGGVSPLERPTTLDLSAIVDDKKKGNTPYKHKQDKASENDPVSPSRAFIDEILGLYAPTYRQLVLVRNITRPPMCLLDENDLSSGESVAVRRQRLLNQWVSQCAVYVPSQKRSRVTFAALTRIFDATLDLQRSHIVDLSYRDDICTHMRRMCLVSNLPERYAHVPMNIFARTYNSELLENAFLPRLVFQARNEQWRQLELHELEQAPYIPAAARAYAHMCTMRTLGYVRGEDDSWVANYAVFHYQLERLADRLHLDDSPFVLVLGTRCYVRRKDQFFACNSAREAMLVWLMFVLIDHPQEHRRDFTKCVSTGIWVLLGKELITNVLKSSNDTTGHAPTVTLERAPLHALDIDMRTGDTTSDDLSDSGSGSSESECEENLVEQYMQCEDLL